MSGVERLCPHCGKTQWGPTTDRAEGHLRRHIEREHPEKAATK